MLETGNQCLSLVPLQTLLIPAPVSNTLFKFSTWRNRVRAQLVGQSLSLTPSTPAWDLQTVLRSLFSRTQTSLLFPRLPCPPASEIPVLWQRVVPRGRLPEASGVTLEEVREKVALQNQDSSRKLNRRDSSRVGRPARLPVSCQHGQVSSTSEVTMAKPLGRC